MVRMPSLPVGQNHHARTLLPDNARNLHPVLVCVLHAAIRNIKSMAVRHLENAGSFGSFARTVCGSPACSHLSLGEIEDAGAAALLGHLKQRATTGLLHIIAVRSNSKKVECGCIHAVNVKKQMGNGNWLLALGFWPLAFSFWLLA